MEIFKIRLNNAFKEMRKKGLVARQNYLCCQTCAGYGITTDTAKRIKEGKVKKEDVKGCVFYHHQDTEGLRKHHSLYLAYGPMDSEESGLIGLEETQVGAIVCECLKNNELEYEWNGSGHQRILVKET